MEFHASALAAPALETGLWISQKMKQGANAIHIDFIDPCFADNFGLSFKIIEELQKLRIPFWVHYMAFWNENLISKIAACEPLGIFFHAKMMKNLEFLFSFNTKIGQALEIGEGVSMDLEHYLLMTVKPGQCGQKFDIKGLEKMQELKNKGKKITIDGGIRPDIMEIVAPKNPDYIVIGSALNEHLIDDFKKEARKI